MSVTTREEHMATGAFAVDVDFSLDTYAECVNGDGDANKLHILIVNTETDELECAPLLLLGVTADEEGMTLTGGNCLWHLGLGTSGPPITRREYVSGADKLGNGRFLHDDLYWQRPAQGSLWVPYGGVARCIGGLLVDDVLASDEPFPTVPGNQYRLAVVIASGSGRWRQRVVYQGKFNPPNLLVNGGFEDPTGWTYSPSAARVLAGARSGAYSMRVSPIPKPQLIDNGDFSAGSTGWTLPTTFAVLGGGLVAYPNVKPQYVADPSFETGTGWSPVLTPAPMSPDITLLTGSGEAASGSGVVKVGPVTQHQVLTNADFGDGGANWYASSTDADPHAVWEVDATEGNNGTECLRTTGWSTAGRPGPETIKYLRADRVSGGGVETYDVAPGETYRAEAYFKAAPGSEGQALISIMIPHPTVPGHDTWWHSQELDGLEHSDMRWNVVSIENVSIPPNRFDLNALVEVRNHGLGYWYVDTYTITRTRGNRAMLTSDTSYPVVADTEYELAALVRSGGDMQVGNVRLGVVLTGPGMDPQVEDVDKGSTDYEWTRVPVRFTPPTGYTEATPFIAGLDIVGDPAWVDYLTLTKVSNNSDVATHASFDVLPNQEYLLSADVTPAGATRGTLTVGVTLSGPGVADQDFTVTAGIQDDLKTKAISVQVRPADGYVLATPWVRSTDVEGGIFVVDNVALTKVNNNSETSVGTTFTAVPERTYEWTQDVFFAADVRKGSIRLSVQCTRPGVAEPQSFVSSTLTLGEEAGTWQTISFRFTLPSAHDQCSPRIIATDVEGDVIYLDNGQIRDADTATTTHDLIYVDPPSGTTVNLDAVAPEGATHVSCQVIAEQGTAGWIIPSVSLARTGVTPATGDDVVADLLTDLETGLPLSVEAGNVDCPEVIPEDWEVVNQHNLQALLTYCNVVSDPVREFHMAATDPPSIDVGTAADVFTDHSDFILLSTDIDVGKLPPSQVDMTERATEVRVAGAERRTLSGRPILITARVVTPGAIQHDWNQNPIHRVKSVSDGTVDHRAYAEALAGDLAYKEAHPSVTRTFTLSGTGYRPATNVGDWIYLYHPDAGFEDASNPVDVGGSVAFPRRTRILTRSRSYGPGRYRIVVRREDGTTFNLPGVIWSGEESTSLTVGQRRPDWQRNPTGPSASIQWMRDRISNPGPR